MTGTAMTEEEEFGTIYNLDIVEIPTNRPVASVSTTPTWCTRPRRASTARSSRQVKECHEKGQPVLVGTVSIEKNELLSQLLSKEGIQHNLLNAKNHEKEAEIVAQAGKLGAVTVATNMAGRGTDIMLGGNAEYLAKDDLRKAGLLRGGHRRGHRLRRDRQRGDSGRPEAVRRGGWPSTRPRSPGEAEKVRAAGGLFIIGTERHESRRIDNQLRGRAGRQGDPGETRFYLSLEDDLMRLFGGERIHEHDGDARIWTRTPPSRTRCSPAPSRTPRTSVESRNFQTRKTVLEYDDVMNKQREIIYEPAPPGAGRRWTCKDTMHEHDAHRRHPTMVAAALRRA